MPYFVPPFAELFASFSNISLLVWLATEEETEPFKSDTAGIED